MYCKELCCCSNSIMTFFSGDLPWLLPDSHLLATLLATFLLLYQSCNFESFFSFSQMTSAASFSLCAAGYAWAVTGHLRQMRYCQGDSFTSKMHIFLSTHGDRNNHQISFSACFLHFKQICMDCIHFSPSLLIWSGFFPEKTKPSYCERWGFIMHKEHKLSATS